LTTKDSTSATAITYSNILPPFCYPSIAAIIVLSASITQIHRTIQDKQGTVPLTFDLRLLAALYFVTPSVERLLAAVTIDHTAVFEESWRVIQVYLESSRRFLE